MSTTQTDFLRYLHTLTARQATDLLSDQQLLQRFLHERSEASFAALVARHGPMVLSVCRRVLQHAQDAEDAFQATFLVLARKAGSIRKQTSLGSWLHGAAYFSAERLRAKARRRTVHERRASAPPPKQAMDDLTWRELRSVLDEELQHLPEKYRAPLVLCYLEGRTQDEAARQLGWSKNTFRRRLEAGRHTLGHRLTRRGVTLSAALTAPLLADAATQAALPPLLAANTVRAGLASALGQTTSGLVSPQAATLAEGATHTLLNKNASAVLVLLLSLTLGLGGLLTQRAISNRSSAEAPAAPPAPPRPTPGASKDEAIDIKGRVLDPEDKPVAGAKVYLSTYDYKDKSDPKLRFITDSDGRFHFLAHPTEVEDHEVMIAAVAPGFGIDWASLKAKNELTLHLAKDDVPIKGRLLDLEGRPIAAATVRLIRLWKLPSETLTTAIKDLQANSKERFAFSLIHNKYEHSLSSVWGVLDMPKSAKSGADGRFQLRGLGRDRIAEVLIEGKGIESRAVTVLLRPGLAKGLPPDVQGPTFDHLAAPSKPIRGTVREKGTGKPIAGIRVGCQAAGGEHGSEAFTDKEGHYEIHGIRKSEQYFLNMGYRNPPYVNYSKTVGDTPGLEPVTANLEMERGLVLRIRVTEKDTGKPVRGLLEYVVRSDNPSLSRFTTFPIHGRSWNGNTKDGTYEQVVLPGPGYIAFRATRDHYARSRLKGREHELFLYGTPLPLTLGTFHAVVSINPSADDVQSLSCNIVLDRGRTLSGTATDPDGRPLSGALAWGTTEVMSLDPANKEDARLAASNFTATGLDPRYPRTLIFYHPDKMRAKALLVRGDEKGPLTVRLQPLGTLTGRVVDAAGKPCPGVAVTLSFAHNQLRTIPEEYIFSNSSLHQALLNNPATTDKNGRFRIEGLVEGLKYDLNLGRGERYLEGVRKDVAGKPGATVDAGEIKMEAPSTKNLAK